MSAITDEFHKLVAALEAEGHHLTDFAKGLFAKLKGDEATLQAEAAADVQQVEADAAPVVAEAEQDAAKLEQEAVADVKDATALAPVEPQAAPAV